MTPCYNSAKTLRETIESVRTQDYPYREHWIIDGGSSDGSLDIVRSYPHLRWISEKDEGHYHAMNKGIDRATGDVIAILNADDYYLPGALTKVAEALSRQPDWDGLFGDFIFVDGQGRELYRRREACFDYHTLRFCFGYICHPALFVRKRVYTALGGYRHRDYRNLCDYDFALRLAKAGSHIGLLPEFIVCFRYHEFGQSLDKRIIRNFDAEMWRLKGEHGCPGGVAGRLLFLYGHARRQLQKLYHRRTCDLIPARWRLRRHLRERTTFSSNIGLDKL